MNPGGGARYARNAPETPGVPLLALLAFALAANPDADPDADYIVVVTALVRVAATCAHASRVELDVSRANRRIACISSATSARARSNANRATRDATVHALRMSRRARERRDARRTLRTPSATPRA